MNGGATIFISEVPMVPPLSGWERGRMRVDRLEDEERRRTHPLIPSPLTGEG